MQDRSSNRPHDPDQLTQVAADVAAKHIAIAAGGSKNAAAVSLGRLGGLKGGNARAASLNADERKQIAQRAAKARWSRTNGKED